MTAHKICWMLLPLLALPAGNGCVTTKLAKRQADLDRAAPRPTSSGVRGQIELTLSRQVDAWNLGNIDRFMFIYAGNATFSSGGTTRRGSSTLKEYYESKYTSREQMGTLAFENLEMTSFGESERTVLVLGEWRLQRSDEMLRGNFTLIMQYAGKAWSIIHDHTSLAAQPASSQAATP